MVYSIYYHGKIVFTFCTVWVNSANKNVDMFPNVMHAK